MGRTVAHVSKTDCCKSPIDALAQFVARQAKILRAKSNVFFYDAGHYLGVGGLEHHTHRAADVAEGIEIVGAPAGYPDVACGRPKKGVEVAEQG